MGLSRQSIYQNNFHFTSTLEFLHVFLRPVIHSVSQIELSLNPRSQCLHNLGSCHLEVAPALELIHWKNIFRPPQILLLHSNDVRCRVLESKTYLNFETRNHTGEMK